MTHLILRAVVTVALTAVALSGCTTPVGNRAAAQQSETQPAPSLCQDSIAEGCRELTVGDRNYRYYVSPPKAGATMEALLVDLGGPGISLTSVLPPNYADSFRKDLGGLADGKTLLLVEEPWVSGKSDATCRESSAAFYSWARRNWRALNASTAPVMNCPWGKGVYGWNRDTYRSVIQEITVKEGITGLDMAAISFGAIRYTYIDDLVGDSTLARPAAAPGTNSSAIVDARADQVWKSLIRRCSGCTIRTIKDITTNTINRYTDAAAELAERSVPVTDFDVASGLVAAGISTADVDLDWQASTASLNLQTAAQLSDALWMRIGEESVSPALVAYMDEYCQAYPATTPAAADPIRTILSAPNLCSGQTSQPARKPQPVDCIISGAEDTSAPAALAETWAVKDGGTRGVSQVRRHWFTDIATCTQGNPR
jgi:hypothetical protein